MYALVNYSGNQILVKEGEETKIPFTDQKIGSKLVFDNVLFVDDGKTKIIGSPYIKSYSIDASIVSHGKDKKIIVFKKKRRKGYQKKNGHRQNYTLVQVDKISSSKKTTTKKEEKPSTAKAGTKKKAVVKKSSSKK